MSSYFKPIGKELVLELNAEKFAKKIDRNKG